MGVYLTADELTRGLSETGLTQLSDDDELGTPDAEVLAGAIDDAEAEVNAHVGQVLALPLSTVPRFLARLTLDIAIYRLYGRRQIADDAVDGRYKAAVRSLEKVARGEITLGLPATATESASHAQLVTPGSGRVFTRTTLSEA